MRKNLANGLLATMVAVAGGSFACGMDENPSLTLSEFRAIDPEGDTCTFTDGPMGGIVFDAGRGAATGSPWITYVVVNNHLEDNADPEVGRLNTNKVRIEEVLLRVKPTGGWKFAEQKRRLQVTGMMIDSGGTLIQSVPAIDQALAAMLVEQGPISEFGKMASLSLRFQVKGKLLDGTSIESNELDYVLSVCNECMLGCPIGKAPANICSPVQSDGFSCEDVEDETEAP